MRSQSSTEDKQSYRAEFGTDQPSCECYDWERQRLPCKHFFAVFRHFSSWSFDNLPGPYKDSPFFTLDEELFVPGYTSARENLEQEPSESKELVIEAQVEDQTKQAEEGTVTIQDLPRKAKRPRTSAAKCRELLGQIRNMTYIVEGVEDADVLESVMTKLTECHRLLLQAAPKEGVILEPQSSSRMAISKKKPRKKEKSLAFKSLPVPPKKKPYAGRAGEKANTLKRCYSVTLRDIEDSRPSKHPKLDIVNVKKGNNSNRQTPAQASASVTSTQQPAQASASATSTQQPAPASAPATSTQQPAQASASATSTQRPPAQASAPATSTQQPASASASATSTQQPALAPAPATSTQQPALAPAPALAFSTQMPAPAPSKQAVPASGTQAPACYASSYVYAPAMASATSKTPASPSTSLGTSSHTNSICDGTLPIIVLDDNDSQDATTCLTINSFSSDDPKLTLYMESKFGILKPTYWLHGSQIHAGQVLLKKEFPFIDGLQDPAVKGSLVIPATFEFVQIINVGKHWVCISTIGCQAGIVKIFDSLYSKPNSVLIDHACRMLFFQQDTVTFCNEKVQKQLGGSDCGLMAFAFATDLCHGLDPATQRYSQFEMRQHFVSCLESGKMKPFPKTNRRVHCHLSCNRNSVPIFCLCRLPNNKQEYIQCCSCRGWYHPQCSLAPQWAITSKLPWKCPKCKPNKAKTGKKTILGGVNKDN